MTTSRELGFIPFILLLACFATQRLAAQWDPCYCILRTSWNVLTERWEADDCAGSCLPREGKCVGARETIDGTEYIWCDCDLTANDPSCNCKGKARNPNYDPNQAAPLVSCETITPCSLVFHTCNPKHLLTPPGVGWPICVCQED